MANPLMKEEVFKEALTEDSNDLMTLEWAINKSLILVWILILTAIWVWSHADMFIPYLLPIVLIAFILALIIIFFKKSSPFLTPIYAVLEWLAIWVISAFYERELPWIVIQAVSLTFWVFLIMLFLYKSKLIKVTENFKTWVIASTWAIALIYIISIVWSLTWWFNVPMIHESWMVWILFSLFVVSIASLNLVLDFDNIETWVEMRAPKYMEWYTSFWLLITLVWLYLEILKLLSKSRK